MIPSDGRPDADHVLEAAARTVGSDGVLVVVSVLSGSLIESNLVPAGRGRRRREEENRAKSALTAQIERTRPGAACHVMALFGDVVVDTLLLSRNLGADAIWMSADHPELSSMVSVSPIPVVVVPAQADAPT